MIVAGERALEFMVIGELTNLILVIGELRGVYISPQDMLVILSSGHKYYITILYLKLQ